MTNACPRWSILAAPLLATLGCSDPVPLPAQGALTLYVGSPTSHVDGRSCPSPGSTYQIAAIDSMTKMIAAPNSNTPGESLISGENGSSISCSVRKSGDSFVFSGSIQGSSPPESKAVDLEMQGGTIDGTSLTGTVNVNILTTDLLASFGSTMPCTVTVIEGKIKPGSMWATFECPLLTSDPSGACSINSASTVVFENCDGT